MKKLLFTAILILLLSATLKPKYVFAGPQCSGLGGECRINCFSTEKDEGLQDCTQNPKGPSERCCVEEQSSGPLGCGGNANDLDTAIGCIPISSSWELVGFLLKWAIGIGGGIAFVMILIAIFQIMTSGGIPERLKAGHELLWSAISGLILLIFSVFILELVGVRILCIPGFGNFAC